MELFPLNTDDLINARSVESIRIEYKTAFDERNKWSTVGTITAFANDLQNLNGGFIAVGIEAKDGVPSLPPIGLNESDLESLQRDIRIACKKVDPEYQPVIYPTKYEGKQILILWAPAGDNRPYKSPDDRNPNERCFHVRVGAETVKAKGELERQLLELTARIPFDDRRSREGTVLDISPILVKRFLQEIGSDLLNIQPPPSDPDIYKSIRIVTDVQGVLMPRNIGLLYFNERPDRFFGGCAFDVVQFADEAGGNLIEERRFSGPLDTQIVSVVEYLDSLTNTQLRKMPGRAEVERTVAYPYEALEECIANAAYHRSYDNISEPNKVYLYPDRLEIISYPGPVQGISMDHLRGAGPLPPVPARNRRIGEFLKELRLAEMRGTGIPKIRRVMSQNGSSTPTIDFDPERTYFRVILPAHPRYQVVHSIRESSYLWSIGEKQSALARLEAVFKQQQGSGAVAAQLIEFLAEKGDIPGAERVFEEFHRAPLKVEVEQPYLRLFKVLFTINERSKAKQVMDLLPETEYPNAPFDIAVSYKRIKVFDKAHTILNKAFGSHENDADFLHNFAQVKMGIANEMSHGRSPNWHTIRRLRNESVELLRRALTLKESPTGRAWCYFDMARCMIWLRNPPSQIQDAFDNAINLLPIEPVFRQAYERWRRPSR